MSDKNKELYVFKHDEIKNCIQCPMSNYEGEWCNILQDHICDEDVSLKRHSGCELMKTGIASYLD